jgi:probable phosphoglycerate mutase
MAVVLVRHAETEWSLSGRHTGRTDIPLTDVGRAKARALAQKLQERVFDRVVTSPLSRAVETAALAGFPDAERDADLVEWDYGEYEGLTTPQIREGRPGWLLWRDGAPGGEAADDVGERVDRVIERLATAEGDALVFAHGHLLRVLAARWLEQPAAFGGHLPLDTGAMSVLGYERETRALMQWNST